MGSLVKCDACKQRSGARPTSVYWRWMVGDGRWLKYRARLCGACLAAKVMPLDQDYGGDVTLTCPACGIATENDYDGVYLTLFDNRNGQSNIDSPMCARDAAEYRIWVRTFALDISDSVRAPEPEHSDDMPRWSASQTLSALGRPDNVRR